MNDIIQKAIEGGYTHIIRIPIDVPVYAYEQDFKLMILDPLFWQCAFGEKYARIKALELMNYIFDGGTIEQFFNQESNMGTEQQGKT